MIIYLDTLAQGGAISQKNGQFSDPGGNDRLPAPLVAGRSLLDPCSDRSKTPSPWGWPLPRPCSLWSISRRGLSRRAEGDGQLRTEL